MIRQKRRGWPLKNSNTKKGETRMMLKGNLLATSRHGKREVNILSTNSNPSTTIVTRSSCQGCTNIDILIPVANYNQNMGELTSLTSIGLIIKWDVHLESGGYIFWFLVQTAMVNLYLVIKSSRAPTQKRPPLSHHLLFRMIVLDNLQSKWLDYSLRV
ncbi:hypothetical protein RRG08_008155 [Elysia crispata]|uniref:Uncharacterized protein n=1 Tax=Elysia crispata TaxID=231223 RepID=A0AAE0Z545_9GAST|nr:hypothetical protein RRG08_008155 [Elysia crispata]